MLQIISQHTGGTKNEQKQLGNLGRKNMWNSFNHHQRNTALLHNIKQRHHRNIQRNVSSYRGSYINRWHFTTNHHTKRRSRIRIKPTNTHPQFYNQHFLKITNNILHTNINFLP